MTASIWLRITVRNRSLLAFTTMGSARPNIFPYVAPALRGRTMRSIRFFFRKWSSSTASPSQ